MSPVDFVVQMLMPPLIHATPALQMPAVLVISVSVNQVLLDLENNVKLICLHHPHHVLSLDVILVLIVLTLAPRLYVFVQLEQLGMVQFVWKLI